MNLPLKKSCLIGQQGLFVEANYDHKIIMKDQQKSIFRILLFLEKIANLHFGLKMVFLILIKYKFIFHYLSSDSNIFIIHIPEVLKN